MKEIFVLLPGARYNPGVVPWILKRKETFGTLMIWKDNRRKDLKLRMF